MTSSSSPYLLRSKSGTTATTTTNGPVVTVKGKNAALVQIIGDGKSPMHQLPSSQELQQLMDNAIKTLSPNGAPIVIESLDGCAALVRISYKADEAKEEDVKLK